MFLLIKNRPTGCAKTVYQTQRFAYERRDDERCVKVISFTTVSANSAMTIMI